MWRIVDVTKSNSNRLGAALDSNLRVHVHVDVRKVFFHKNSLGIAPRMLEKNNFLGALTFLGAQTFLGALTFLGLFRILAF